MRRLILVLMSPFFAKSPDTLQTCSGPFQKGSGSDPFRITSLDPDHDHGSWIYRSKFHLITELLSVTKGRFSVVYGGFLRF